MPKPDASPNAAPLVEVLHDITTALLSTLDLDEVFERILYHVGRLVPHQSVSIMLIEEGIAYMVGRRRENGEGLTPQLAALRIKVAETPDLREMVETGNPILIPDVREYAGWIPMPGSEWVRSHAAAPIRLEGQTIGFLQVNSAVAGFYTSEHAERLMALADLAALAIHNARSCKQAHRRAVSLETLYQLALEISTQLELNAALEAIVESSMKMLRVRAGGIYLYRPDEDVLEWVVSAGRGIAPPGAKLRRGEGLAGKVWERGEAMSVDNYSEWEGRSEQYRAYFPIRAVAAAPILWRGQFLGVVNVVAEDDQRTFSAEDMRLLSLLAAQAAVAIQNANLYAQSQERAQRLEVLARIARLGTAALNMEELLQALADTAALIIGGDGCYITRWDAEHRLAYPLAAYGPMREKYRQDQPRPGEITLTESVLKAGHTLVVEDVHNTPYLSREIAERYPTHSMIALPLRVGGEFLGALLIGFDQPHRFSADEVAWAEQAAELIALVIARARTYAELEQRVEERTRELRQAHVHLLEMSEAKDTIIRSVSHELRTPLTALKLYHHLLAEAPPERHTEYLAALRRTTARLERLIEDLLSASRLGQPERTFEPAPLDLIELCAQLVGDFQPLAAGRGLVLDFEPTPNPQLVYGDHLLLEQALSALLTNALNYTPAGGVVKVGVRLRHSEEKHWVGLEVSDNGPGIPPEELPHLFERFYRGRVGRESGVPGTGLGLANACQIAQLHGGWIEAVSAGVPGQGATFTLWLPLQEGEG